MFCRVLACQAPDHRQRLLKGTAVLIVRAFNKQSNAHYNSSKENYAPGNAAETGRCFWMPFLWPNHTDVICAEGISLPTISFAPQNRQSSLRRQLTPVLLAFVLPCRIILEYSQPHTGQLMRLLQTSLAVFLR